MADISVLKNWKVGVKNLGEHTVLPNQVLFCVNLSNKYDILSSNQDYMIECFQILFPIICCVFILFIFMGLKNISAIMIRFQPVTSTCGID